MITLEQHRRQIFVEMMREHAKLVTTHSTLDQTLANLARGAARLADVAPELAMIRVVDPRTGAQRQDVDGTGRVLRAQQVQMPIHHPERSRRAKPRGITTRAIETHRVQMVHNVLVHPDYVATHVNTRSELALPLIMEGRCWGALNIESRRFAYFKGELISWLEAVALEILVTIQADSLNTHFERDGDVTGLWMNPDTTSLQEDLYEIAREVIAALTGEQASAEILALSTLGDTLVSLSFASENPKASQPSRLAPGTTISWCSVRERRTIGVPNITASHPQPSLSDSRAALAMPLRSEHGAVIGVLNVEAPQPYTLGSLRTESLLEPYRQRAEMTLRHAAREPAALFAAVMTEIGDEISKAVDPQDFVTPYQLVLRRAVQMIGKPNLSAAIAFRDGHQLSIRAEHTYNFPSTQAGWVWPITRGTTGRAVRSRSPVFVPDVHVDIDYFEMAPNAQSELVVPLMRGDDVLGIIDIASPDVGAFYEQHVKLVEALAEQVVHALGRAEQIRRGQLALQRMSRIRWINVQIEDMLRSDTPKRLRQARDEILGVIVRDALEFTHSNYGCIITAVKHPEGPSRTDSEAGTELVLKVLESPKGKVSRRHHWPAHKDVTGRVYRERRLAAIEDVASDPDFMPYLTRGSKSELALPILSADEALGVLNLESTTQHVYSHEQIEWAELLASQAANVLSAADLHLVRGRLKRLMTLETEVMVEGLFDGGISISSELQGDILQAALDLTLQEDGYASLWLVYGSSLIRQQYLTREPAGLAPQSDDAHSGIVPLVREWGRSILALDLDDPQWSARVNHTWRPAQSELAVPLLDPEVKAAGRLSVLGVLNVESRRRLDFDHHDVEILEQLARLTVAAIRNRNIYRSKVAQIGDITHTVAKVLYPLRTTVEELKLVISQSDQMGLPATSLVDELSSLSDMANTVLGWFQQMVPGTDMAGTIEPRPVGIAGLLRQFEQRTRFFAEDRYKTVRLDLPTREIVVECQPELIQAALFLLTDNALRYGPEHDEVIIKLRRFGAGHVRLDVIDHGQPIPEPERDFIFEPGYSGPSRHIAHKRGAGVGSGLGLDHVRRIVEKLHHGKAGYQVAGDGHRFFITLPIRQRADKRTVATRGSVAALVAGEHK